MKLLAIDYDKTLKCSKFDLKRNIKSLKKYMVDNLFLLNTGRSYPSIKKEIDKYKIPYHYLSCNDGNILFDNNNQVLYASNLDKNILFELEKIKIEDKLTINPIIFLDNILEYEIIISKLNQLFLLELKKIMVKYNLCLKIFKEHGVFKIYIYDSLISKSKPIEYIREKEYLLSNNIYTVGDNINDLEMLRDYHGYSMIWSKKEIKKVSEKSIISVKRLIDKLRR